MVEFLPARDIVIRYVALAELNENTLMNYLPQRPALSATIAEAFAFAGGARITQEDLDELAARMPKGAGPVLLLPTILHGDPQTAQLRQFLDTLGYDTFGWDQGINLGPSVIVMSALEARLRMLSELHGLVSLVGFSMGGLFARWLAIRHPDQVRQVITGCSPFRQGPNSAFVPLDGLLRMIPRPDLYALSEEISEPLPVPGTFIYSRKDGIVAWESCLDPEFPLDNAEVGCPHVTMVHDIGMFEIIARRLADPECGLRWSQEGRAA